MLLHTYYIKYYRVNITFICTEKPKLIHFIAIFALL